MMATAACRKVPWDLSYLLFSRVILVHNCLCSFLRLSAHFFPSLSPFFLQLSSGRSVPEPLPLVPGRAHLSQGVPPLGLATAAKLLKSVGARSTGAACLMVQVCFHKAQPVCSNALLQRWLLCYSA
ncbi:hypothetical protein PVAP13_8KG102203 [Panicum virgatum]|uniref:Uncharacterized protein n=1 Tax=Panicum virgatum TaxID=38727 RepID=A0A8T0PFI9_PANVG|nr:hypothetical protein PVAP13_8KG102203 [Panicum virgatum]